MRNVHHSSEYGHFVYYCISNTLFYNSKITCDRQKQIVDLESWSKNKSKIIMMKNKYMQSTKIISLFYAYLSIIQ